MKRFIKFFSGVIVAVAVFATALWLLGPYEDADLSAGFDATLLDGGLDQHFAASESVYDDIRPGVHKQVLWAGEPEIQTPWSVLYIHGFSATAQEIRPVPDRVAAALGANLILTRLAGHGRTGEAMAEPSVSDWMRDVAEGIAAARVAGERVLVLTTSTGGTLAAAAAVRPDLMEEVAGVVMVSPNFGVNNPLAPLLTWPAARHWMPWLAGAERSFDPANDGQAQYWTTRYPSVAALPMAALVKAVIQQDLSRAQVPALFLFSEEDKVVVPAATHDVMSRWGGEVTHITPQLTEADDPFAHVIAGDILSPGQTDITVSRILTWAEGL